MLLLFGTIVGDFALISDVSARAFKGLAAPANPPAWLVAYDGRGTMCLFALVAVFPLCCLKGMRQVQSIRLLLQLTDGIAHMTHPMLFPFMSLYHITAVEVCAICTLYVVQTDRHASTVYEAAICNVVEIQIINVMSCYAADNAHAICLNQSFICVTIHLQVQPSRLPTPGKVPESC